MVANFIIVQSHCVEVALAPEAQLSLRDQQGTQQSSNLFPNPIDKDPWALLCSLKDYILVSPTQWLLPLQHSSSGPDLQEV